MNVALPSYPQRAVHLTAVWAYAVSQPVFSLLQGNPQFLAVRGFTRTDVIVFAVSLTLVPPLLAVALEWLVSRMWQWGANILHTLFLVAFLIPLAMQVAKWIDPSTPDAALLIVWAIAVASAAIYLLWRPARLFLSFSLVLPVIGFATFVSGASVAVDTTVEVGAVESRPPIVVLVFDELPVSSLMNDAGAIDAARYPNFAQLARDGTWYRNATTVHSFTNRAVPAILTGRVPRESELPILADHPENLFTLLGSTYSLRVHESWTRLCPLRLCPRERWLSFQEAEALYADVSLAFLHRVLPGSLMGPVPPQLWIGGLNDEPLRAMIEDVSARDQDGVLYFTHVLLPHAPWQFLPSGRRYGFTDIDGWSPDEVWADDSWAVQQGFQRHLLQVEYADVLLGRLMRRLEQLALYDRALVIVVADHGASFRPGDARRPITRSNLADIANVPLLVKYPGQRRGGLDTRFARTIDIVPTVAEVLGMRLPWAVDGESLLSARPSQEEVVVHQWHGEFMRAALAEIARGTRATVRRKVAVFGEGADSLYRIGVSRSLLGARVKRRTPSTDVRIRVENEERLADVRKSSGVVPARISGVVEEGRISRKTELAVAVNGRVRALTRCVSAPGRQRFRALVPESAFTDGYNRVDVFAVVRGPTLRLIWLGGSRS